IDVRISATTMSCMKYLYHLLLFTCCFFMNSPLIYVIVEGIAYKKSRRKEDKLEEDYQSGDTSKGHLH
ncbi:hypothetical protein, partial [Bacillus cereus]